MKRIVSLCLWVTFLNSCATSGKPFPSDLSWIRESATKKEDVKNVLGEPNMVGHSGGSPTWTYGYYKYRLIGSSHTKELKFYWNPDGTVNQYSFNSSFPDDVKTQQAGQAHKSDPADKVSKSSR